MSLRVRHGTRAIAVVIVLDEHFLEIGGWRPPPAALQPWATLPGARRLPAVDRYLAMRRWYARDRGRTTLHGVLGLLGQPTRREHAA